MKPIEINRKTFRIICIGIGVCIFVLLFLLFFPMVQGVINGNQEESQPEPVAEAVQTPTPVPTKDPNAGAYQKITMTFNGETINLGRYYIRDITIENQSTSFGISNLSNKGYDLLNYTLTNDEDLVIEVLASQIKKAADERHLDDAGLLSMVLTYVSQIPYKTDAETKHSEIYPRTPVVTIKENVGDSTDHAILASALLKELDIANALAFYPSAYVYNQLIPEAGALVLIQESSDTAPVYEIQTNYPSTTVRFYPDQASIYPAAGYSDAQNPSGDYHSPGWYFGNGYWTDGKRSGSLGKSWYYPDAQIFTAENLPQLVSSQYENIEYVIPDAHWIVPGTVQWLVDIKSKGYPPVVYKAQNPVISSEDILWRGNACLPVVEQIRLLPLEQSIKIPIALYSDEPRPPVWKEEVKAYFSTVSWHNSNVSWSFNDVWRVHDQFLSVIDTPETVYTPWGYAVATPGHTWRLAYSVGSSTMTPYSSAQIVVYKILDDGTLILEDITGWQGTNSADKSGYSEEYPAGTYAIGVFVRNTGISVTIQIEGEPADTKYQRSI